MKPNEIVLLSCNALYDRKVRTLLTILMVVVGSALIIILNGLSAGQSEFIKNQLNQLAPNILYVTPGQQSFRGDSSQASITVNSVVVNRIKSLPFVNDVIPQYRGSVQLNSQGNIVTASVLSMDPEKLRTIIPKIEFEEGSLLKQNDPTAMLVSYNVANPPGKSAPIVSIGQTVRATFSYVDADGKQQQESRSYVVSGIIKLSGDNQIDQSVIINQVGGTTLLHKTKYDRLIVAAESPEQVDTVQQEITNLYGSTIGINSPKAILALREQFTSGNNAFILSVGFITLIVGAVGIVTTLYTSVTERVREIGTIKAIGAQNTTILSLFLVEALLIGVIGATLGLIVGMIGGYGLSSFLTPTMPGTGGRSVSITPIFLGVDMLKIWLLSVTLSVSAGIFPAWKASRLSPMIALRRE
ncbi:MAG TPA: ABC transporter permease [Candidatus Nitrosotenuis sp.]|nr:ABC transporter permease [Candidatus Nitrosotenuis sp.]